MLFEVDMYNLILALISAFICGLKLTRIHKAGCHLAALAGLRWQGIVQMPMRRESGRMGGWTAFHCEPQRYAEQSDAGC